MTELRWTYLEEHELHPRKELYEVWKANGG
jgi:hypothetical protein